MTTHYEALFFIAFSALATIFLYLAAAKAYLKISSIISNILNEHRTIEKLLCDIRDGTRSCYAERRRLSRTSVAYGKITAAVVAENRYREVGVLNLSCGNALIRATEYFVVGQIVDMDLRLPLFPQPIRTSARVIRSEPVHNICGRGPLFDVGLEFLGLTNMDNERLIETIRFLLKEKNSGVKDDFISLKSEAKSREYYYMVERKFFSHTIRTLVYFIDSNDKFTYAHSKNVVRYSIKIAKNLGLDKYEILKIKIAALFHDIGKYKVGKAILEKQGNLTPEEWEEIKKHPITSAGIVNETGIFSDIADIIKYHHSKYSGGGYPDADKKGEDIPIGSRIISVADSYDAMTSNRPYRNKPFTQEEALEELLRCSGTQFDPQIVDAFVKNSENR